jgi:hypothetical protein
MSDAVPVEIWRQIFAVAARPCVHAERCQTTADYDHDPFNLSDPHLLDDSLKTKSALCLVSKGFNSLATEFLYESVHFTSHERLNSAIQHSSRGGANKFWWTRVLVLQSWYTMDSAVPSVARLLSKCLNLRLVVFAAPTKTMGPEVDLDQVKSESVYRSLPRSVQAIRWEWGDLPIFQSIPAVVLDNICQMSIESSAMMSTPALTLPRVTHLRAKDVFAPANLTFPALRTVCLVAWGYDTGLESSPLGLFIQRHGQQITTLQIENRSDFGFVQFPVPLLDCCTNLKTLMYDPFEVCARKELRFDPDPDAVQHTKLTHVYLFPSVDLLRMISVEEVACRLLWVDNHLWLLHGGFPVLKHIIVRRSCALDPVDEQTLSLIVNARPDPRLELECGMSACT